MVCAHSIHVVLAKARTRHTTDVRGVEIGRAAKNVLAIAAGIVVGRKLGASAQAARNPRFTRVWIRILAATLAIVVTTLSILACMWLLDRVRRPVFRYRVVALLRENLDIKTKPVLQMARSNERQS